MWCCTSVDDSKSNNVVKRETSRSPDASPAPTNTTNTNITWTETPQTTQQDVTGVEEDEAPICEDIRVVKGYELPPMVEPTSRAIVMSKVAEAEDCASTPEEAADLLQDAIAMACEIQDRELIHLIARQLATIPQPEKKHKKKKKKRTKTPPPPRLAKKSLVRTPKRPRPSSAHSSKPAKTTVLVSRRHSCLTAGCPSPLSSMPTARAIYSTSQTRTESTSEGRSPSQLETIESKEELQELFKSYGYRLQGAAFTPEFDLTVTEGLVNFMAHRRFHVIPALEASPFYRGARAMRPVHKATLYEGHPLWGVGSAR